MTEPQSGDCGSKNKGDNNDKLSKTYIGAVRFIDNVDDWMCFNL